MGHSAVLAWLLLTWDTLELVCFEVLLSPSDLAPALGSSRVVTGGRRSHTFPHVGMLQAALCHGGRNRHMIHNRYMEMSTSQDRTEVLGLTLSL